MATQVMGDPLIDETATKLSRDLKVYAQTARNLRVRVEWACTEETMRNLARDAIVQLAASGEAMLRECDLLTEQLGRLTGEFAPERIRIRDLQSSKRRGLADLRNNFADVDPEVVNRFARYVGYSSD